MLMMMLSRRRPSRWRTVAGGRGVRRHRIGRALLLLLVLAAGMVVALFALAAVDVFLRPGSAAVANGRLELAGGRQINAYIARPPIDGEHDRTEPVVLMFHEWWGLNGSMAELAEILSLDGYTVVVPDLYAGRAASTVPGALALRLTANKERITGDAVSVAESVRRIDGVDPNRVATVGFCFGGDIAMELALARPEIPRATVVLYGGTEPDPERLAALRGEGPILGIFAAEDRRIPLERVHELESALIDARVNHRISIYPGVGHAFVQPDSIVEEGTAMQAWAEIRGFLDSNLRPAGLARR